MAKTTEVISDFSGGIVKGYAEENLKNNQLTDCNNLIADGVGKINTIPNTLSQSASDFNVNLPSAKGKNIHVISSDVNLQNANSQTSNVTTAGVSITELDKDIVLRLFLYISPLELSSDDIHIKIDDVVRNETLIDWHLDGSIFSTNDSTDNEEQKTYGAVHQIELNAHSDNQNNDLSCKDVINWKWLKTTKFHLYTLMKQHKLYLGVQMIHLQQQQQAIDITEMVTFIILQVQILKMQIFIEL